MYSETRDFLIQEGYIKRSETKASKFLYIP
jgi:hypothetical protein